MTPENYEYPVECTNCMSEHKIDELHKCSRCGDLFCDNCIITNDPDYSILCRSCVHDIDRLLDDDLL